MPQKRWPAFFESVPYDRTCGPSDKTACGTRGKRHSRVYFSVGEGISAASLLDRRYDANHLWTLWLRQCLSEIALSGKAGRLLQNRFPICISRTGGKSAVLQRIKIWLQGRAAGGPVCRVFGSRRTGNFWSG